MMAIPPHGLSNTMVFERHSWNSERCIGLASSLLHGARDRNALKHSGLVRNCAGGGGRFRLWRHLFHDREFSENQQSRKILRYVHFFANKFEEVAQTRRQIRERVGTGDKAVSIYTVEAYFKQYLTLIHREWEMYRGGVIAQEVFLDWAKGTYTYMTSAAPMEYFGDDGRRRSLLPRDAFLNFLERSDSADPEFASYIHALLALPELTKGKSAIWQRKLVKLIKSIRRSRTWTL